MATLMMVNPKKRRKVKSRTKSTSKTKTVIKYRKAAKKKSRRRRNPIKARGLMGDATTALKDGAVGSLGAIAGTVVAGYLPLPAEYKTGPMGAVAQALVSIFVGVGAGKVLKNKKLGRDLAQGGVTVALHETMKGFISQAVPQLNLGEHDGLMGYYDDGLMGEFMNTGDDGLGYVNAGINPAGIGEYVD